MKKVFSVLRIIGCVLCGAGCVFFLLPVFRGGFNLGAGFGMFVCLLGLVLLLFFGKLSRMGGWKEAAVRLLTAFYCLGLAWAIYLTGLMFSVQSNTPPENTNVIVLGAQVYGEERMGVSLSGRVQAAYEYLAENPEALCIVTGGQGGDEPCPEAVTQKNVLVKMGIEEERIFLEDQSHNTRENMMFAKEIAEDQNMGEEVTIVTQSFHMYRAAQLAKAAGFTPYCLIAETDPLLFPEYYGRELLSLTKWWVERLVIE
mgnify:FL=1